MSNDKIKARKRLVSFIPVAVTLLLFLITTVYIGAFPIERSNTKNTQKVYTYNNNWYRIVGHQSTPVLMPSTIKTSDQSVTIYHPIPASTSRNYDTMFFDNLGQSVIVSVDGELLFSINSEKKLSDLLKVTSPCIINLPAKEDSYLLEITFTHLDNHTCNFPEIYVSNYSGVVYTIFTSDIPTFISFVIICVLLLLLLAILIFFSMRKVFDHRIDVLFLLLLCISSWAICDSPLIALIGFNLEKARFISYLAFLMLPLTIMRFVKGSTTELTKSFRFGEYLVLGSALIQLLNVFFGLFPTKTFLPLTHFAFLFTIFISYRNIQKMWKQSLLVAHRYLAISLLILLAFGSVSIFAHWVLPNFPYRAHLLAGLLIFVFGLSFILLDSFSKELLENEKQIQHMTLYKKLAMYDGLTGLGNRRSFEKAIKDVVNATPCQDALLIMLDLNGLKYTNDTYGHRAGDDLICASGEVLTKAYQNYGEIFRIGGDEFAVIIKNPQTDTNTFDKMLQDEIDKHNETSSYPLSIARGACRLIDGSGKPLSAGDWKQAADVRMYANKRARQADAPTEAEELREIIQSVVDIVEARDTYTANHSDRVAALSVLIAKKLGLSEQTVADIHSAAQMHDIGKIAISESILLKPDKLTDLEYNSMKQHPVIGASIISNADSMGEIAQIIRHHHERYDGKGYPDRLSMGDIPIGARVIAIADSIDAMTSKRCYRDALPLEVCFEEIKKNLNKMYDPAIGKIVIDNWDEIAKLLENN